MTKYRVTLVNAKGWRLQVVLASNRPGQPYDLAEQLMNTDEEHGPNGPWRAVGTERAA